MTEKRPALPNGSFQLPVSQVSVPSGLALVVDGRGERRNVHIPIPAPRLPVLLGRLAIYRQVAPQPTLCAIREADNDVRNSLGFVGDVVQLIGPRCRDEVPVARSQGAEAAHSRHYGSSVNGSDAVTLTAGCGPHTVSHVLPCRRA